MIDSKASFSPSAKKKTTKMNIAAKTMRYTFPRVKKCSISKNNFNVLNRVEMPVGEPSRWPRYVIPKKRGSARCSRDGAPEILFS
jgi:hypothetical protein